MPQMGESVVEATVIEWTKQVGDTVEEDETLLEISTDKVDSEVPSSAAGIHSLKLEHKQDETIEVGQVIAVIATGEGAPISPPAPTPEITHSASLDVSSEKATLTKDDIARLTPEQLLAIGSGTPNGEDSVPRTSSDGRFFSPISAIDCKRRKNHSAGIRANYWYGSRWKSLEKRYSWVRRTPKIRCTYRIVKTSFCSCCFYYDKTCTI